MTGGLSIKSLVLKESEEGGEGVWGERREAVMRNIKQMLSLSLQKQKKKKKNLKSAFGAQ